MLPPALSQRLRMRVHAWLAPERHAQDEAVRRRFSALEARLAPGSPLADAEAALRALPYTDDPALGTFAVPGAGQLWGYTAPPRSFHAVFRGPRERVRASVARYPALLEGPVLDLGCGRGELLDALRDAGIAASGVDADPAMAAACRRAGHDVAHADAVEHLGGREAASLGAVAAVHLVEHLPFDGLRRLLSAAHGALRPGGVLLLETVNPHAANALRAFWIDPTHRHPLFPEALVVLCGEAGFARAGYFCPDGSGNVEDDRFRSDRYTVLAWR